jgi:hypothetical protein
VVARRAVPARLFAGAIVGALLLAGAVFLFRRRSAPSVERSDSDDVARDLESDESTLFETLVKFSDTVTVDGVLADPIVTLTSDDSRTLTLIG